MSTNYVFTDVKRVSDENATKTTDLNTVAENTDELQEDFDVQHSKTDGTHEIITCTGIDKSGGTGAVGGGTKRVRIETVELDGTSPPGTGRVGYISSVDFDPAADEICYFSFKVPNDCDVSADIALRLGFCMSSANAGTVVMAVAYQVISVNGDATPSDTGTDSETIDPSNSAEIYESNAGLAIANADITATTQIVGVKLYRDADHASDTHTGDFRLMALEIEYTTID